MFSVSFCPYRKNLLFVCEMEGYDCFLQIMSRDGYPIISNTGFVCFLAQCGGIVISPVYQQECNDGEERRCERPEKLCIQGRNFSRLNSFDRVLSRLLTLKTLPQSAVLIPLFFVNTLITSPRTISLSNEKEFIYLHFSWHWQTEIPVTSIIRHAEGTVANVLEVILRPCHFQDHKIHPKIFNPNTSLGWLMRVSPNGVTVSLTVYIVVWRWSHVSPTPNLHHHLTWAIPHSQVCTVQ